jgi:outer membrane protein OmpA-like peptidoglycan-associated protein
MSNDAEGSVAAQGIAGLAIPTGIPGLSLTAEYRFMATFEDTSYDAVLTSGGRSSPTSVKLGSQYNHTGLIGFRYAFNAAPAAPPPAPAPVAAPAPAPARTYLVFFDWDKADLTDRARQIIAEAAQNSTRVQLTQIEVSGHADRTGTAAYNLALSRRRADNVAAELVRLGVPKNVISIQAYGDTRPLVPTAAGVREPQNRRVEIVLK